MEETLPTLREAEGEDPGGADRDERTVDRATHRHGHRDQDGETRRGTVPRQSPQRRRGSCVPACLEPRRRSEPALTAVIPTASALGVSTRQVDDRVPALGMTGFKQSAVSARGAGLDELGTAGRQRLLTGSDPYGGLHAKYGKIRDGARVLSLAYGVATGVTSQGEREVLGRDVGPREAEACWTGFRRDQVARGFTGLPRVIRDAPSGRGAALRARLQGAPWPRCRGHARRSLHRSSGRSSCRRTTQPR